MKDFGFSELPSESELDVENPIYDLLIKEEELHPAAQQMQEDLTHISTRMNSLEDNHPAREPLQDEVNTVMKDKFDVEGGLDTIAWVNENLTETDLVSDPVTLGLGSTIGSLGAMFAVGSVAAGPIGMMVIAAPMLGAGVLAGYVGAIDSVHGAIDLRGLVNDYLDMASKVHDVREDFDDTWVRLVGDEGGDLEPDDSLAGAED